MAIQIETRDLKKVIPDISTLLDQERLSGYIALKDWEKCWGVLYEAITPLQKDTDLGNKILKDFAKPDGIKKVYDFATLASKVFIGLLLNDEVTLPDHVFYKLLFNHPMVHDLLYIIGAENTDVHVQAIIEKNKKLTPDQQKKLCMLLSLNTSLDITKVLDKVAPRYRASAIILYMGNSRNIFNNHEANKIKLFKFAEDIPKMDLADRNMSFLNHAYFGCSYIDYDQKHNIKKNINQLIRKYLKANYKDFNKRRDPSKTVSDAQLAARKKPVILISSELFSVNHAMYRSWKPALDTLKQYFEVHYMMVGKLLDKKMESEFDSVFTFEGTDMGGMLLHAESLRLDVILMPSVGMVMNNLILSNTRLAPVQMMTLGHPATTMSEYVDFVIGQNTLYDARAFKHDKYVVDPSPYLFHPHEHLKKIDLSIPKDKPPQEILHVGVTGGMPKMSITFYKLLEELPKEAGFDIQYTFLLSKTGPELIAAKIFILKTFPSARVFGEQQYRDYFTRIQEVDIVLNQFPFGQTNTLIDTLLAGKPSISLDGYEPHSKTASSLLEQMGLKDKFLVYSLEEYKTRFFELAKEIMAGKRDFFDPAEVYDCMFVKHADNKFGKVVHWIYENQDRLKASKDRYFEPDF